MPEPACELPSSGFRRRLFAQAIAHFNRAADGVRFTACRLRVGGGLECLALQLIFQQFFRRQPDSVIARQCFIMRALPPAFAAVVVAHQSVGELSRYLFAFAIVEVHQFHGVRRD